MIVDVETYLTSLPVVSEGVKAKVYFKASPQPTDDGYTFMNIDSVKMDFSVQDIKMGVDNIANGNSIIRECYP